MSNSFKEFLKEKKENPKHCYAFFEYEHDMHDTYCAKIKNELRTKWQKVCDECEPKNMTRAEKKANTKLDCVEVDDGPAKVGRYGLGKNMVHPSVKIGAAYSSDEANTYKIKCMKLARKCLEKYCARMNKNVPGSPFSVQQDDGSLGDIRLGFQSGKFNKTIFLIAIEPGHKFERIYFRDFLNR